MSKKKRNFRNNLNKETKRIKENIFRSKRRLFFVILAFFVVITFVTGALNLTIQSNCPTCP